MLSEAGLPSSLWGEALAAQVYVFNLCPTSAVLAKTLCEAFYGRKPNIAHLRIWGCLAYVHVQKDKNSPLGYHIEVCVHWIPSWLQGLEVLQWWSSHRGLSVMNGIFLVSNISSIFIDSSSSRLMLRTS